MTVIDDEDGEIILPHKWSSLVGEHGHVYANRHGGIRMHYQIMGFPLQWVDHIDRDTLNNRRSNLRLATGSQNQANRGLTKSNTSGFKGVFRKRNKFMAQIRVRGKLIYIGLFGSAEQAAAAYDSAASHEFGEFALTNSKLGKL